MAAHLAGGISRLTSKRSFYAGVAVGAAGTGGVMLLVNRFRRSTTQEGGGPSSVRPISGVNYGSTGRPIPPLVSSGRGGSPIRSGQPANGGMRSNRPQMIPMGGGRPAGGGVQTGPRPISMAGVQPAGRNLPRVVPVLRAPLPDTKLQPASIKVQANGQVFTPTTSYRVLTPDGQDTGLAITPEIVETGDSTNPLAAKENSWCLTHTRTGQLISGPYDTVSKAQKLATQLAPLPWGAASMSSGEMSRAQQLIADYQQSLEGNTKNEL